MATRNNTTWDVVYQVNGKTIEVLARNKPLGVAKWIKKTKEESTHRLGSVLVKPNGVEK